MFEAGEYDHVFDVDMGDGIIRKLPFDNGSNPLEAADKFIIREGLPKGFIEQITTYLRDNSQPFPTRDHSNTKKGIPGMNPTFGTSAQKKSSLIPWKQELYFD
mmetsp:Transcript_23414/g.17853  ORF Transcript_23414/g.17853 Transcript_23414/m.17853 type:complete len:103 (-) Transcript_23414:465-773(-)